MGIVNAIRHARSGHSDPRRGALRFPGPLLRLSTIQCSALLRAFQQLPWCPYRPRSIEGRQRLTLVPGNFVGDVLVWACPHQAVRPPSAVSSFSCCGYLESDSRPLAFRIKQEQHLHCEALPLQMALCPGKTATCPLHSAAHKRTLLNHCQIFPRGRNGTRISPPGCSYVPCAGFPPPAARTLPGRPKQHKLETKWKFEIEMKTKRGACENRI